MPAAVAVETRIKCCSSTTPHQSLLLCYSCCLPCTPSLTWGDFHSLLNCARASGELRMPCKVQLFTVCVHHSKIYEWWNLDASDQERNWTQTLFPLGSMALRHPNKCRGTASNTSCKTLSLPERYAQHPLPKKGGRIVCFLSMISLFSCCPQACP